MECPWEPVVEALAAAVTVVGAKAAAGLVKAVTEVAGMEVEAVEEAWWVGAGVVAWLVALVAGVACPLA